MIYVSLQMILHSQTNHLQKKPAKYNYKSSKDEFDKIYNAKPINQMEYTRDYSAEKKAEMKNSILNDLDLDDLDIQPDSIVEPVDMPN